MPHEKIYLDALDERRKKKMVLRPYQETLVAKTLASLDAGNKKVVLQAPTGAGKSLIISEMANRLLENFQATAIVVKHTALINQIAEHLFSVGVPYSIMKAGMDDKYDPEAPVHLIMAQTLHARLDKVNISADVLITDECHVEWGTKRMMEITEHVAPNAVVGLSATPYDAEGYMLEGVDDLIVEVTEKELTEQGYLAPLKYFVPKWSEQIDYDSMRTSGKDYSGEAIEELIGTKAYAEMVAQSVIQMKGDRKKTIVFANSIDHAELLALEMRSHGLKAQAYHSETPKDMQIKIMHAFRTSEPSTIGLDEPLKCNILVSVNKVSIGFDLPNIELAVMCRPTKVLSLWRQSLGRSCRIAPGKEYAEVLDLCGGVTRLGFHDDPYHPPVKGDKKALLKAKQDLEAPIVPTIVGEEPTEVDRKIVIEKMEEIKRKASNPKTMTVQDLITVIETTRDPLVLIRAGFELHSRAHGTMYRPDTPRWAAEPWIEMLENHPEEERLTLTLLRNRMKKIIKERKKDGSIYKPSSIRFFAEWVTEESDFAYKYTNWNE